MQLLAQMEQWIRQGDKLLLFIDANENMKTGKLARGLRRLSMRDLVRERAGMDGPPTHHRGSEQIDGVWGSSQLECTGARFLPFWWGAGDHRVMVVDIPWSSLIGQRVHQIPKPKHGRLQWTDTAGKKKYLETLSAQWNKHKMRDKVKYLQSQTSYDSHWKKQLQEVDQQRADIMRHAERKCKKARSGAVAFSPGVNCWKKRREVWNMVIKWHKDKTRNRKKITRHARKWGVEKPLSTTEEEARYAYKYCHQQYTKLKPKAPELRDQFLRNKRYEALQQGKLQAAKDLSNIMARESAQQIHGPIRSCLKKGKGRTITRVQYQVGDNWVEVSEKEEVERVLGSHLSARFTLTDDSILRSEEMVGIFGLVAETEESRQVLNGTYTFPEDFDPVLQKYLKQIAVVDREL